jgi:molybdopterin converting factor small subunit
MSITVNYLGLLADTAGKDSESFEKSGSKKELLESVYTNHPEFRSLSFVFSLNGAITHGETQINKGDEITLIPPAPGG